MADAIAVLKAEGAEIVDPADIPSVVDTDAKNNFLAWGTCSGTDGAKGKDANCSVVLKYGMKRDFNVWLATLGASAPVKTLAELRALNTAHASRGAIKYGQANLDVSDEMNVEKDKARWEADRKKDIALGATHGIDEVMKAQQARRAPLPRGQWRRHRRQARLPDGDRAVRHGRQRADPGVPRRVRGQADPLRRELLGPGLQRAAPDRIGLRLRTGHQEAGPPARVSVAPGSGGAGGCSAGVRCRRSAIPGGHHDTNGGVGRRARRDRRGSRRTRHDGAAGPGAYRHAGDAGRHRRGLDRPVAERHERGAVQLSRPGAGVPRAHREVRGPGQRHGRHQRQRHGRGHPARPRACRRPRARTAARHPDRHQGHHQHDQHADDRRRAGLRRLRAALRRAAHQEPARRRRDHLHQDRADRVRQLGDGRHARQLQRRCSATATTPTTRGPIRATPSTTAGRR